MTRQPKSREEAAAERAERIEAAQAVLADAVGGIRDGQDWQRFLGFQAKLHAYSANNCLLIATQHRKDYWLYVIDKCADGQGRFFGAYQDPATLFATDMTGHAIFRVPGSSLKNAPGSNT